MWFTTPQNQKDFLSHWKVVTSKKINTIRNTQFLWNTSKLSPTRTVPSTSITVSPSTDSSARKWHICCCCRMSSSGERRRRRRNKENVVNRKCSKKGITYGRLIDSLVVLVFGTSNLFNFKISVTCLLSNQFNFLLKTEIIPSYISKLNISRFIQRVHKDTYNFNENEFNHFLNI